VCWNVEDGATSSSLLGKICDALKDRDEIRRCQDYRRKVAPVGTRVIPRIVPIHGGTVLSIVGVGDRVSRGIRMLKQQGASLSQVAFYCSFGGYLVPAALLSKEQPL